MTYQDPKLPEPGLGRNPPRYGDLDTDAFSTGSIIALIFGTVLIGGVIFSALSERSTTASNSPPTTTGQGGERVSPPTAPRMVPAAPSTTVPPIDQNVPAEMVAPPIPAEPRTNN
jgi:hypothetical protein